ncbi:MAG: AzlD domain-containing protein [Proteobacteria bacterium]|nr:AzlD domain-containing protein [Pseudomonadota bacterium]
MSATDIWLVILLMTLATIITRCSFFLLGDRIKLPSRVQHALRYAPAAALAAIIAPDLFVVVGADAAHVSLFNPKLLAAIAAGLFFIGTRRMLGTIMVGMVVFTLLRLFWDKI